MTDTPALSRAELARILAIATAATPGVWSWSAGMAWIETDARSEFDHTTGTEHVLWPANHLCEPRTWNEAMGACGLLTEPQAEQNALHLVTASPVVVTALVDRIIALEDERAALADAVTDRLHAASNSTASPDEACYWHDSRPFTLMAVHEAVSAPAPGSEIADEDDLIDMIEDGIDRSMDQDWRYRDGAKLAAELLIAAGAIRFGPPAEAPPKADVNG